MIHKVEELGGKRKEIFFFLGHLSGSQDVLRGEGGGGGVLENRLWDLIATWRIFCGQEPKSQFAC